MDRETVRSEIADHVRGADVYGEADESLYLSIADDIISVLVLNREAVFQEVLTVVSAHSCESRECQQADADKATEAICALATTRDDVIEELALDEDRRAHRYRSGGNGAAANHIEHFAARLRSHKGSAS
jgi:hypothetical protein